MNILEMAMAAKMGGGNGGGGGGGASSWNAVTGKPFDANNIIKSEALPEGYPYKETAEGAVIVSETTFEGTGVGNEPAYDPFFFVTPLVDGATYKVVFDGKDYTCKAAFDDYTGGVTIGNFSLAGEYENTGEPFLIADMDSPYIDALVATDTTGEHTIKILEYSEIVKRIDMDFLPEGYPYKEQNEVVVLEETTVTGVVAADAPEVRAALPTVPNIEDGKEYLVRFKGTVYKTTKEEYDQNPADGTHHYVTLTDITMSFFCVVVHTSPSGETDAYITPFDGEEGDFTVGITAVSETIHPMAPEFLPAGVGVPTVTADDNGKFLRVVDGKWVAVALESAEGGSF